MQNEIGFVVAAYAVMWIGLIGYGVRVHNAFRDSRQRLDQASRLEERGA